MGAVFMVNRARGRSPEGETLFAPGDLVRHRRYGYRGLVVAFDLTCGANEEWYQANNTQPGRDQPWYHVLVHGSHQTTYAAQDSLLEEPQPTPIEHPLLETFFSSFEGGRYLRNDRPWNLDQ
jgi:heat shock protein HspQ